MCRDKKKLAPIVANGSSGVFLHLIQAGGGGGVRVKWETFVVAQRAKTDGRTNC